MPRKTDPWQITVAPPLTPTQATAWELWLAITEEAECAPDAPLEVVWRRLVARGTTRTFSEVSDALEAIGH